MYERKSICAAGSIGCISLFLFLFSEKTGLRDSYIQGTSRETRRIKKENNPALYQYAGHTDPEFQSLSLLLSLLHDQVNSE